MQQPPGPQRACSTSSAWLKRRARPAAVARQARKIGPERSAGNGRDRHASGQPAVSCAPGRDKGSNDASSSSWSRVMRINAAAAEGRRATSRRLGGGHGAAGVPEASAARSPVDCRGLDYYTGTVFETFLDRASGDRQRLLRWAVRQSGRAVHKPGAAWHRRFTRPRPAAGGDGRAASSPESGTPAPVLIPAILRRPTACTTICKLRDNCGGLGSGSSFTRRRRSWASSSNTPKAVGSAWPSSRDRNEFGRGECKVKALAAQPRGRRRREAHLVRVWRADREGLRAPPACSMDRSNHYESAFEAYLRERH